MAKGDDIQKRLIRFAADIVQLCNKLPTSRIGNHISGQLLRSGTSPAANYAEARAAESQKDFIHKMKIVLKELNETEIWLFIIRECELIKQPLFESTLIECTELSKIINAGVKTASAKKKEAL